MRSRPAFIFGLTSRYNVPMPPINKIDKSKNLGKTHTFRFRTMLLECLRQQPYFAIRLGEIDENSFQ